MNPSDVFDSHRQQVRLGRLIGEGGQGAVYEVVTDQHTVAKVYHTPISRERADKIRAMPSIKTTPIDKLTAWPKQLLLRRSGDAIGLLMPRVFDHKDIHNLYSPKGRRTEFPRADLRFLIRASTNTARAFAVVHDTGCVIGDVNQGGILVSQDATVKLVDCDSFQIRAGGKTFFCEGGVETFTPPELQGKSLNGVIRTHNHDNFGLAVMVFLTLFMGRHPFAGRYLGAGNIPIDKAISECRFPYGSRRAAVQMEPPPSSPSLDIVGDDMAFLFERAFSQEMIPGGRPEPSEWVSALQKLERNTKQCPANPSHWHLSSLTSCPWCRMEAETGVALFPFLGQQPLGAAFDIDALWRQISGIPHPGPAPTITGLPPKPSNSATSLKGWDMRRKLFGACAAGVPLAILLSGAKVPIFWIIAASIAAFFIVNKLGDQSERVVEIRRQRDARSSEWARVQEGWSLRAGPTSFDLKKAALGSLKNEWIQIPNLRLRRLDELKSNQRNLQLEAFLDGFDLDRTSVSGIGPARKQMLVSYGIETAADITEGQLARVPGFGPVLRSKLMAWRKSAVDKFRFDPKRNIDPRHIAKVEQDVLGERKRIEDRLRSGIGELRAAAAQILAARQQMRPQLEQAHAAYLQAVADFDAAKS